jgi:hypothetical protein
MSPRDAIKHGRLFRWTWVLEEILDETDVSIVVHSSWRRFLPFMRYPIRAMKSGR